MIGCNIGMNFPSFNFKLEYFTVAFIEIQQDWWTAAGPLATTPLVIVCLVAVFMCDWLGSQCVSSPGSCSPCLGSLIVFEQPTDTLRAWSGEDSRGGHTERHKVMVLDESFVIWSLWAPSHSLSHVDTAGNRRTTPTPVHTNGNVLLQSAANCTITGLQCSPHTSTDLEM